MRHPLYHATEPTFAGAILFLVLWGITAAVIWVGEGLVWGWRRVNASL